MGFARHVDQGCFLPVRSSLFLARIGSMTAVFGILLAVPPAHGGAPGGVHWPSFRGPGASGVAEGFATPTTWNVETGENIRWKTPIAGLAHSSPIVWGDRVFVTTAVPAEGEAHLKVGLYGDGDSVPDEPAYSWRVLSLDKATGKVLWEREAHRGVPRVKRHPKATHANCTPATDGKHVVAFFASEGLYCYDLAGELLWKKDLGVLNASAPRYPELQWGFASSPIIHEGRVIVQCDVEGDSFVAALDVRSGGELWRMPREEDSTWGTPAVVAANGGVQVVCNGYKHIGGYDFATGKAIWWMKGGGDVPVPTPVFAHDLIFVTNAHGDEAPIYAVRPSAMGDITLEKIGESNAHIAWSKSRRGNYMQTLLVYGDYVYACRDNGIFTGYQARTGAQTFRKRVGTGNTGFTASAVAANGKVYLSSELGDIHVFEAGAEYKPLAVNAFNEICMATPAISEGMLLFRLRGQLVAVGNGVVRGN